MPETITEGAATLHEYTGTISRQLPVFYNPHMQWNRDISILLLNSQQASPSQVCLPLAGSGVRGIRFLLELTDDVRRLTMNDSNEDALQLIRENLALNNLQHDKRVQLSADDASSMLLASTGYDYIDIDPFGTPNPFLDTAVKRISRNGILAVTSTDTGALCGTFPNACRRKYWSEPLHSEMMHESGLRILARKVMLIGMQHRTALMPIFSYAHRHYFRLFFKAQKSRKACDKLYQFGYLLQCPHCLFRETSQNPYNQEYCPHCKEKRQYAGPLWLGDLWDHSLAQEMAEGCADPKLQRFLQRINEESGIETPYFYDVPTICKRYKLSITKKLPALIEEIEKKGYAAARSHFRPQALRTDAPLTEILQVLKG